MSKKIEKATEEAAKEKDVISTDKPVPAQPAQKPKSLIIKIEDLVPFHDHPYQVKDGDDMDELAESVEAHGILNPLIVRPLEGADGKYEIISGHRRRHAAEKLGIKKLPCTVYFVDRDTATVMMVDSNCQRTELLPSEKAFAYKLKYEALSHQGTSRQVGAKSRTSEEIAETAADSARQIQRYIRLTNLIPELLDMMDKGKIAFSVGVELSFLDEPFQRRVLDACEANVCTPSFAQAVRMHKAHSAGELDGDGIDGIMCEEKANQREKITIPLDRLKGKIPSGYTAQQQLDFIVKACDYYSRYLLRDRGAR